jgi:hypothetical protein
MPTSDAEAEPALLRCAECGRQSEPDAAGWRAYLDDDDQAVTFCSECAEREFGKARRADGRTGRQPPIRA